MVTGFPNAGQPTALAGSPLTSNIGTGGAQSFLNADGSINYGGIISGLGTAAGGAVGSSAAAGAQVAGINSAIGTQQGVQQTNTNLFQPQISAGNQAFGNLTSALTPGSGFSMSQIPGLTGAVNTAETAQNNLFASFGALGNSGTSGQIGNYIAGNIALPAYNNYVQNLIATGQLGSQGNQSLASSNLQTGGNISQLQQNKGVANSSGVAGTAGAVTPLAGPLGSLANSLLSGLGANASGMAGGINGLASTAGLGHTIGSINGGQGTSIGSSLDGQGMSYETPDQIYGGSDVPGLDTIQSNINAAIPDVPDISYDLSSGF